MAKAKDVTAKRYIFARIVNAWPFYGIAILRKVVQHLSGTYIPCVLLHSRVLDTDLSIYDWEAKKLRLSS